MSNKRSFTAVHPYGKTVLFLFPLLINKCGKQIERNVLNGNRSFKLHVACNHLDILCGKLSQYHTVMVVEVRILSL